MRIICVVVDQSCFCVWNCLERTIRSPERMVVSFFFWRSAEGILRLLLCKKRHLCQEKIYSKNIIVLRNENLDTSGLASAITKTCPC